MVFNSPQVQGSFSPILWVELPQSLIKPNLVVFAILKSLASDFSWCGSAFDLNELLHNLHCRLLNNKYLIVLDNVWHASNWYFDLDSNSKLQMEGNENYTRLSHGLPRGSGGAIIVTSRLNAVASKMVGKRNLYPLEPTLDTESCWSIVIDSIEKGISDHWILEKIKDDMVDRCGGLPLAAKTLADIISHQFLTDPSAIKEFHLEFEKSVAPTSEVLKEIRSCPEVYYAKIARDHDNKVEAGGNFNPQDVVNALRKFSLGEIKINGIEPLQKQ
ncbi:probable disease resistance protein At5g45440 isoform X1 [Camellia sinensis]|uniref:probable disease resistance protein At5g45440 isoform X1 n=1 Tax=Camellia sinensis TaxID=4442 RepID=UPI0010361143|nr:probable disease resistance protein At5g45440 isoform X1 [Camellia sinensis]